MLARDSIFIENLAKAIIKFAKACFILYCTIQTNNKWCAYELNSKFDKTYKIYLKVSQFDIEKDSV
jgi:hypothetical protein